MLTGGSAEVVARVTLHVLVGVALCGTLPCTTHGRPLSDELFNIQSLPSPLVHAVSWQRGYALSWRCM
jgi:hypothetical protein